MDELKNAPRKKIGRPKKSEVSPKRPRGRPKGSTAIMNDYRDRMLASPKSRKVLEAIFDAALDSEHKNQAAAWTLIMDRVAPKKLFENEIEGANQGSNAIKVTITTAGGDVNIGGAEESKEEKEPMDGEYTEVE